MVKVIQIYVHRIYEDKKTKPKPGHLRNADQNVWEKEDVKSPSHVNW